MAAPRMTQSVVCQVAAQTRAQCVGHRLRKPAPDFLRQRIAALQIGRPVGKPKQRDGNGPKTPLEPMGAAAHRRAAEIDNFRSVSQSLFEQRPEKQIARPFGTTPRTHPRRPNERAVPKPEQAGERLATGRVPHHQDAGAKIPHKGLEQGRGRERRSVPTKNGGQQASEDSQGIRAGFLRRFKTGLAGAPNPSARATSQRLRP